ncbi:serine hydrolase [Streptomyces sp. NPDC060194]|uniref:serine hydrolase n=1 Tax=Streptomyces sp. NPDC060194 TaxID=3347069 RepID=UPI0036490168
MVVAEGVRLSLALLDTATGARVRYDAGCGADRPYVTASVVKAQILAALLLREDGRLDAGVRERAAAMIRCSDNDAATELWRAIGGAAGLDASSARLGLTATRADERGRWGLTRTTAADQLRLLQAVFGDPSPLGPAGSAYLRELMAGVVAGQDWGVSAAGPAALKNGWLPRTGTGLWVVNSVGRVRAPDGRTLLVAVLSDGHASLAAGIAAVEEAVRAAAGRG